MKLRGSVRVVRRWHSVSTDPLLRCFDDSEGLDNGTFLAGMVPEFASWLMV
jgi:hypothetical protein